MSHIHLVGITQSAPIKSRLERMAVDFEFGVSVFANTDLYSENFDAASQVLAHCLHVDESSSSADIAGALQVLRYGSPLAFSVLIISKKYPTDQYDFIKKSGADLIIQESDAFETSILDFALSQVIRGALIPVKFHDFKQNSSLDFSVYSILPLNKKIVPVVFKDDELTERKYEKLKATKELYISRNDVGNFQDYLKVHKDLTADGLQQRCRANYLNLCKSHCDLILSLFDRSDTVTFQAGKNLLDKCTKIATEMLMNLSSLEDPWSVINNSTIGETGSAERSPAVAAMAGLMTMNVSSVNTDDTILAGLLADVGLVVIPYDILANIRKLGPDQISVEESILYHRHPLTSIEKCLEKRLPLNERIKSIIACSHERFDRQGFPEQINPTLIPKESQVLQYCEFIDQRLMIKMGEKNKASQDVQIETLESELSSKKILDLAIAYDLKKYLRLIEDTKKKPLAS